MKDFIHVESLNEAGHYFSDFVNDFTFNAARKINRLNSESQVSCAFRRAAHVVKSIWDLKLWLFTWRHPLLKVIRVNNLSMQIFQYHVKCLLSTAHVSFNEVRSLECAIIYFFKRLPYMFGSQWISRLWMTEFSEQVFQITKQAHLSDILLLLTLHRRVRGVFSK